MSAILLIKILYILNNEHPSQSCKSPYYPSTNILNNKKQFRKFLVLKLYKKFFMTLQTFQNEFVLPELHFHASSIFNAIVLYQVIWSPLNLHCNTPQTQMSASCIFLLLTRIFVVWCIFSSRSLYVNVSFLHIRC